MNKTFTFVSFLILTMASRTVGDSQEQEGRRDDVQPSKESIFVAKEGRELRGQVWEIRFELAETLNSALLESNGDYRQALDDWKKGNEEVIKWTKESQLTRRSQVDSEALETKTPQIIPPKGASSGEIKALAGFESQVTELMKETSRGQENSGNRFQNLRKIVALKRDGLDLRNRILRREGALDEVLESEASREAYLSKEFEMKGVENLLGSEERTMTDYRQIRESLRKRAERLALELESKTKK